jgi:hypothetical protein
VAWRVAGVWWNPRSEKWEAVLMMNGQVVFRELLPDQESAARAYDKAARQHFGQTAILNFPDDAAAAAIVTPAASKPGDSMFPVAQGKPAVAWVLMSGSREAMH